MSPRIIYGLIASAAFLGTNTRLFAADKEPDVATVLTNWEWATAGRSEPTEELRNDWLKRQQDGYSVHALALVIEFHGPVSAKKLQSRYTWRRTAKRPNGVQLTAAPRDRVERLFLKKIRVVLSTKTWLPSSVSFVTGSGKKQGPLALHMKRPLPPVQQAALDRKPRGVIPVKSTSPHVAADNFAPTKPEVDAVLLKWANATSRYRAIEAKIQAFQYYLVFNVEKHGQGRLRFEKPNRFTININPIDYAPNKKSMRKNPRTNRPFTLRAMSASTWKSDGKRIVLNPNRKPMEWGRFDSRNPRYFTFTFAFLGKQNSQPDHIHSMLGFSSCFNYEVLKRDFRWKLLNKNDNEVWLQAFPVTKRLANSFRERKVILNTKTWLPKAEQTIDPTGSQETVRVYSNWIIEKRRPLRMVQRKHDTN